MEGCRSGTQYLKSAAGKVWRSPHSAYRLKLADVLTSRHDLYKWQQDHQPAPPRSASFSHLPIDRTAMLDSSLVHIREPGGFRRNFVVNRAHERGEEPPSVVRNVVDFLFLYGHFVSACLPCPFVDGRNNGLFLS